MMSRIVVGWCMAIIATVAVPRAAFADGKRDLADGIAFYDSLEIDRARTHLALAGNATDLSAAERAKALVYLGMLESELGKREAAESAWLNALALDGAVELPTGTSPKVVEAFAATRKAYAAAPKAPPPAMPRPDPGAIAPEASDGSPGAIDTRVLEASAPAASASPPGDDTAMWLWLGVGGAVVVAAVVTVAVIFAGGGGGACDGRGGGCISVTVY